MFKCLDKYLPELEGPLIIKPEGNFSFKSVAFTSVKPLLKL